MPFCQIWLIFVHSVWNEKNMACFELCVSPVLTQNEDIWNFHGSLTLNIGKLIWYFGSLLYAIVSNMTHFCSFCLEWEKYGLFWTMCFTCIDAKWRHLEFSRLTDFEYWETNLIFWKPLVCHCVKYDSFLFILFGMRKIWPVLNYVFHLYWRKMKTFGIFTAHWLWILGN